MAENKKQGEIAELTFQLHASENGYAVSTPIGDSAPYDAVVEKEGRVYRVQIKSTAVKEETNNGGNFYVKAVKGGKKDKYEREDFDILAVYVVNHDVFYLIPFIELQTQKIQLYPHRDNPDGFYERFKERWNF